MAPAPPLPAATFRRRGSKSGSGVFSFDGSGWAFRGSLTVLAAASLAALVTFTLINAYMHGLAPSPAAAGFAALAASRGAGRTLAMVPPGGVLTIGGGAGGAGEPLPSLVHGAVPRPPVHPFADKKYKQFNMTGKDRSPRCRSSQICDGDHSCGPDGLGCVTSAKARQRKIRDAIKWSWQGYKCAAIGA